MHVERLKNQVSPRVKINDTKLLCNKIRRGTVVHLLHRSGGEEPQGTDVGEAGKYVGCIDGRTARLAVN
jgi:hypothetical protein